MYISAPGLALETVVINRRIRPPEGSNSSTIRSSPGLTISELSKLINKWKLSPLALYYLFASNCEEHEEQKHLHAPNPLAEKRHVFSDTLSLPCQISGSDHIPTL